MSCRASSSKTRDMLNLPHAPVVLSATHVCPPRSSVQGRRQRRLAPSARRPSAVVVADLWHPLQCLSVSD